MLGEHYVNNSQSFQAKDVFFNKGLNHTEQVKT